MKVESELKKDGIEVIEKLNTQKVQSIAKNIATKLCETFPNFDLNQNDLFNKLSKLNMYRAMMPEGMAEANYFYKNSSIYFNSHVSLDDIEEFAIHECIHYLQEVKDKKNRLLKMGLSSYTDFRIYGLGLNEAAVQLMTSKILGIPKEYVKYFNISFETTSPSYYPIECCLVSQLSYLIGEDTLFESTIHSNDNFKNELIKIIDNKAYMKIQNNIDVILSYQEEIINLNNKIAQIDDRNKKVDNMINKINSLKKNITSTFINTQNLIISNYFDKTFNLINDLEGVENYRRKLYKFKDYLGSTDGYTYFNNYYVSKMNALEYKYNQLENGTFEPSVALIKKKESKLLLLFRYIKNLFTKNNIEQIDNDN